MFKKILVLCLLSAFFLQADQLKSPQEFFNQQVGSDRVLINYPEIISYFKYLAANSPRVRYSQEGLSTLGNPLMLAVISAPENIDNLEQLVEINRRLQNPDLQSEEENRQLLKQAKLFVLISGTIHSTEIGASQAMLLWAHKLAAAEDKETAEMLSRVVLLLMPSINPDGHILVVDWYKKYLGTRYEGAALPFLYHHYAGHDNNRDYCFLNLKESQVVNRVYTEKYVPAIFLDMRQMGSDGPRMFVPPFANPLNPNLSPLMLRQCELIGSYLAFSLQQQGLKGVATGYGFDAYWPGGTKNTAWYKNVVGLLTEVASCKIATPVFIESNELRGGGKGLPVYKQTVNFPDPWPGGWWGLKDIVDYELKALDALLKISARHSTEFIANFSLQGKKNIEQGKTQQPAGYLIPDDGKFATYLLLTKLKEHGVRLYRLKESLARNERFFAAGSFLIPLAQPFRPFIKAMLEKQSYPEIPFFNDGPIIEPYDNSGWTMPLLFGVKCYEIEAEVDLNRLELLQEIKMPAAQISGNGSYYVFDCSQNSAYLLVNRLQKKGIRVWRITKADLAGHFALPVSALSAAELLQLAEGSALKIKRMDISADLLAELKKPRLAVYQPYLSSMDEGWTRWVLDYFEFPYKVVRNPDFKNKNLLADFDLLLFASMPRDVIVEGKFKESDYFNPQSLPPQYQGGIGKDGVNMIKEFVRKGGRLILLDAAFELAQKDFEINIRNVVGQEAKDFQCPGSILKIEVNCSDPLGWGMESESALYFASSAAFRTAQPNLPQLERRVVARFSAERGHLLSGYLKGEEKLNNAAVAVRYNYERGMIFVFGGRIQYRGQSFVTFKLLFNAIHYVQ